MLEEIPKEDYFDHHVFEEPAFDCEEDVGVIEDILYHTKKLQIRRRHLWRRKPVRVQVFK
jgi:hypothetical protein